MKPYPNEELERMSKLEIIRLYKRTVEQVNDAVPVVRCKECRHLVRYSGALVCSEPNGMMTFSPDGFCSYGQRRDEERREDDHTR